MKASASLVDLLVELIRATSCDLPSDVEVAIRRAIERETPGSLAQLALTTMLRNAQLARAHSRPICQDTGTVTFYVKCPFGFDHTMFERIAKEAVREATKLGYLRVNTVDSGTGSPYPDNIGPCAPVFEYEQQQDPELVEVYLLLKGGGCENVSTQYSLPDPAVGAHRDLTGCKKVVLDAIVRAQGKGCAPGVIGVCIGGDRAMGYKMAKRQLLRRLDDINPDPQLARFEEEVFELANSLGIGPMGFGGRTTLLGVKACTVARVPASFFVTVSYMCWAFRRRGVIFKITGELVDWI